MATSIIADFMNGFIVEENDEGRDVEYRLRKGDRVTAWTRYEKPMMLDGHVAVSPYYTDKDAYILCTSEEACKYFCAVEMLVGPLNKD